jgi:hypothetical protein
MTLYHDPSLPYPRPSLVGDLLGVPATTSQHQLENQTTTVLAWLVDRSRTLARTVLGLFLGPDAPVNGPIGAQTQVSLAKPGGGALRPDLSICVGGLILQLLVEVKVGSDFHIYPEFGNLLQPDAYRLLWAARSPGDAEARAVGTLTREGSDAVANPDSLVARDVSWRELRDALDVQLSADAVEPEVRLVALSFVAAIDERIAPIPPGKDELAAFFAAHGSMLEQVAAQTQRLLGAGPAKKIRGEAYLGCRIALPDPSGQPLFARLYLSPAGSRLNLPGSPDALIAAPERDPNGTLEPAASVAAEAAGFLRTKDFDGFWLHRHVWPLEEAVAEDVAREIADRLTATGLLGAMPEAHERPTSLQP